MDEPHSGLVDIYLAARERNVVAFIDHPESRLSLCIMLAQYFSGDPIALNHESLQKYNYGHKKVLLLVPSTPLVEEKCSALRSITDLHVGSYLSRTDSLGIMWNFKNWQNEVRDKQVLVMTPTILTSFIERQLILLGRDISLVIMYECNKFISLASNLFDGAAQPDANGGPLIFGLCKVPLVRDYLSGEITPVYLAILQNSLNCEMISLSGSLDYMRFLWQTEVDNRVVVYDRKHSAAVCACKIYSDGFEEQIKRLKELREKLSSLKMEEQIKTAADILETAQKMRSSFGDWCAARIVRTFVEAISIKNEIEVAESSGKELPDEIELSELLTFPYRLCKTLEMVKDLLAKSYDNRTVILVATAQEAKALSDFLNAVKLTNQKINAACVTSIGKTEPAAKSKSYLAQLAILDKFRNGSVNVLVSCSLLPNHINIPHSQMVIMMQPADKAIDYMNARLRLANGPSRFVVFLEQDDFNGLQSFVRHKIVLTEMQRHLQESELQLAYYESDVDDEILAKSLLCLSTDDAMDLKDEINGIRIDLSNSFEAATECFLNNKHGVQPQYLDAYPYRRYPFPVGIAKEVHLPPGSPLSMKTLLGPVCLTRRLATKSAALLLCRTLFEANIFITMLPEGSISKYQTAEMLLNPDDRELLADYDDGVLTTVSTYEKITPRWLQLDESWKLSLPEAGERQDLRHTFDWIQDASECSVRRFKSNKDDAAGTAAPATSSKLSAARLVFSVPAGKDLEGYYDPDSSFIILTSKPLPTLMPITLYIGEEKTECHVTLSDYPLPDFDDSQLKLLRDFDIKFFGWMMRDQIQPGQPDYSHTVEPVMSFYKLLPVSLDKSGETWKINWDLVQKVCNYKASEQTLLKYLQEILSVEELSPEFFQSVITDDQLSTINEALKRVVLCTPYNKLRYQATRLVRNLLPTSALILDNGEKMINEIDGQPVSFEQYFHEHQQLTVKHKHVPLVEAQHALWFKNFLSTSARRRNRKHIEMFVHLIPEFCQLLPMTCSQYKFGLILPSILHRLENYLTVEEFRARHPQLAFGSTQSVNLYTAFCAPCANENYDYDRLEIFGDSFLKLACSTDAFRRHPNVNEGLLSMLRVRMVCNKRLFNAGTRLNLQDHIIATPFYPRQWSPPEIIPWRPLRKSDSTKDELKLFHEMRVISDKMVADVLEALIGAYYTDGGVEAGMKLLQYFRIIESRLPAPVPKPPCKYAAAKPNLQALQDRINYHFRDINLLIEAFTHSTAANNDMPSYQRLEYLGDAVLDFIVTRYLMDRFPNSAPGELTDLRTAAVNNGSFGRVSVHNGLHKFIIHDSKAVTEEIRQFVTWYEAQTNNRGIAPHEIEREGPKILGDVFESLCGAIYVDLGYNIEEMWGIVSPMVAPFIDAHCISESVNKHPVRRFYEQCRKLGLRHDEILVKVVEDESSAHCTISIRGKVISSASGNAKSVAKRLAAVAAIEALSIGVEAPQQAKRKRNEDSTVDVMPVALHSPLTTELGGSMESVPKKPKLSSDEANSAVDDGGSQGVMDDDGEEEGELAAASEDSADSSSD